MDRTSAGVSARCVFNGLPFGVVVGSFLVKADDGGALIRMLGEISPRTRLGDTLTADLDTSLVNVASSVDLTAVDKVAMLPIRVSKDRKTKTLQKR